MPARVRVQVQGMPQINRMLRAEPLLQGPLRDAFEDIGRMGVTETRRVGPRLTGKLVGSVESKVGGGAVTKSVKITVKAKSRRGYRYPNWLQYAPRSRHKGWLDAVKRRLMQAAGPILDRAARAIEARWAQGHP